MGNTFKALKNLEVLFLQGNTIMDFPIWEMAFNPYLVSLRLANNLWSCNCQYVAKFRDWLRVFRSKVTDVEELVCVTNEAHLEGNLKFDDSEPTPLCDKVSGNAVAKGIVQEQEVHDYTPLMIATLASFALILLLALGLFLFRHSLRVWIHSKYGVRVKKRTRASSKMRECRN